MSGPNCYRWGARALLLLSFALLWGCLGIPGCTPRLGPTTYGERGGIDGFAVLHRLLSRQGNVASAWGYGPQLEEAQVLVYVETRRDMADNVEFWRWLEDWVQGRPQRRALVVLRDLNTLETQLRRWEEECNDALLEADPDDPEQQGLMRRLSAWGDMFARLADRFQARPQISEDDSQPLHSLALYGVGQRQPRELYDQHDQALAIPETLRYSQVLYDVESFAQRPWEPFISSDHGNLMMRVRGEEGQRVLVASGGELLSDGALVDPATRQVLGQVWQELFPEADSANQRIAWLQRAQAMGSDPVHHPGIMSVLLRPWVALAVGHALVVVLAFLAWRNLWVGRRRHDHDNTVVAFDRHIHSLARSLDNGPGQYLLLSALARWFRRLPPAKPAPGQEPPDYVQLVGDWYPSQQALDAARVPQPTPSADVHVEEDSGEHRH